MATTFDVRRTIRGEVPAAKMPDLRALVQALAPTIAPASAVALVVGREGPTRLVFEVAYEATVDVATLADMKDAGEGFDLLKVNR